MTLPKHERMQPQRGFTMVELIVTMIVIGIMAIAVLPRMDLLKGFDEIGFRDKVKATLEYARKSAVAQRRSVQVAMVGGLVTVMIDSCHPEGTATSTPACTNLVGTYPRNLVLPGSSSHQFSAPSGVALTPDTTLTFDPLGRPSAGAVFAVTNAGNITVEAETGYVH